MKVYIVLEAKHEAELEEGGVYKRYLIPERIHQVYFTREAANKRREKLSAVKDSRSEYLYVIEKTIKGNSLQYFIEDMVANGHIRGINAD